MSDLDISVALNEARLQSTLDFIMLGTGTPTLSIYATTKPSPGDAAGGAALVEIPIGGGSVSSNQLHLIPENLTDMVMNSGGALWDSNTVNAEFKSLLLKRASQSLLLIDKSKFNRSGEARIGHLDDVTHIVSDVSQS